MNNYTPLQNIKSHFRKNINIYDFLLGGLVIFHIIHNVIWIYFNNVPTNWDPSVHLMMTFDYANYVKHSILQFNIIDFLRLSDYYPIFFYIFNAPLAILSNFNVKVMIFSSTFYFIIAIIFLYGVVLELWKDKKKAFYTSFFFSFFITISQASRDYLLDIPLTAALLASYFFLLKLRNNYHIRYIYLFFLVSAYLS